MLPGFLLFGAGDGVAAASLVIVDAEPLSWYDCEGEADDLPAGDLREK